MYHEDHLPAFDMEIMMLKQLLIASLLSLPIAQQAHAILSTEDALSWIDKEGQHASVARMYINGMAEAYWLASIAGKDDGKAVICFPESQNLQTEELRLLAILSLKKALNAFGSDAEGKEMKSAFLKNPVSMSLLMAWQAEYPCG